MAKIIAIQEDYVLLEERGDHYQITISFRFCSKSG